MLGPILDIGGKLIETIAANKTQARELKANLSRAAADGKLKELSVYSKVVIAEINSESWLARNWRPLVMCNFAILVSAHWLGVTPESLTETEVKWMMEIIKIGLGGYVVGRSAEKIVKVYKERKDNGAS